MTQRTPEAKKLWNKMNSDPDFVQKYYRVTNLSICPYMENGVYTEYEFLNDPSFEIWEGMKYEEISREEFKKDSHKIIEWENEVVREFMNL